MPFLDDTTVTGTGLQDEFDLLRTWGLNEVQFTRAVISKIKAIKTEVGTKNSLSISRHILAKLEEFYFGCSISFFKNLHFFLYHGWSNLF